MVVYLTACVSAIAVADVSATDPAAAVVANTFSYTDSEFAPDDWVRSIIRIVPPIAETVTQEQAGGNPGAFRLMSSPFPAFTPGLVIFTGHFPIGFEFNAELFAGPFVIDTSWDGVVVDTFFGGGCADAVALK